MKQFVYLCITPESLVASHLPPSDFGSYLATGTRKRLRGQAMFLEVDIEKMKGLPLDYLNERLVPNENGEPKHSLYLSIYRALENTPLEAMLKLYLATDDGKVLELSASAYTPGEEDLIHLYQQLNPISTRVASKLTPPEFIKFLTSASKPVSAPRIIFADLKLNRLARDPKAPILDLPYPNPDHLRDCLSTLISSGERLTKTVIRNFYCDLSFRTVKSGFYVGDEDSFLFYPFPSVEELEDRYYSWWRSALIQCF